MYCLLDFSASEPCVRLCENRYDNTLCNLHTQNYFGFHESVGAAILFHFCGLGWWFVVLCITVFLDFIHHLDKTEHIILVFHSQVKGHLFIEAWWKEIILVTVPAVCLSLAHTHARARTYIHTHTHTTSWNIVFSLDTIPWAQPKNQPLFALLLNSSKSLGFKFQLLFRMERVLAYVTHIHNHIVYWDWKHMINCMSVQCTETAIERLMH